jgi:hypothetical protein
LTRADAVEENHLEVSRKPNRLLGRAAILALAGVVVMAGTIAVAKRKPPKPISGTQATKPVVYPTSVPITSGCPGVRNVRFGGFRFDLDDLAPLPYNKAFSEGMGPVSNRDKWEVTAHNNYAASDVDVTSFAYCQKGTRPTVVRKVEKLDPSPLLQNVAATCPAGKVLSGGGWDSAAPTGATTEEVLLFGLHRIGKRTLEVVVQAVTNDPVNVTAIALCRKGAAPSAHSAAGEVPEGTDTSVTATCPGRKKVVFMGFDAEYNHTTSENAVVFEFTRPSKKTVKVGAYQSVGGPLPQTDIGNYTAIAYCRRSP